MTSTQLPIDETKLATILKSHGVVQAAIFGSFARGDARPDSDLDLLVTHEPTTTLFDAIDLQNELAILGRKVDLVSKKYLSKRLEKRIQNDLRPLVSLT